MSTISEFKRKKLWFEKETLQVYTRFWNTSTTQKGSSNNGRDKKTKNWKPFLGVSVVEFGQGKDSCV